MSEVAVALDAMKLGDPDAQAQLLSPVYDDLRRLAVRRIAQAASGQTLDLTYTTGEFGKNQLGDHPLRRRTEFVPRLILNSCTLVGVLTLLLVTAHSARAGTPNPRRVLLIYGDQKDLPMNLIVDVRIRSIIREKLNDGVDLFSEYLDVSRFPDNRSRRGLLEFLLDKYSARGLDLIVVIDSAALDQILLQRDWFFPATPVVFCCVTEAEYKARRIAPGVQGTPAKLDYRPTLELALRFHPGTRRVVVIAGATKEDTDTLAVLRRDFQPFEGKVEFCYLVGLPTADLLHQVSELSADTIIIYTNISQDGAGRLLIPREGLVQVSQAASVPIYGYYDSYLGHGIVGGFVASFEIEATNAAHRALRILAGEKSDDLAATEATSCAYMFDWRQLKRWRIDEKDLPPDSVVRFQEPSFWDLYKWQIIGVLSLCAIQALLILGLLVQRARRRRAETEIRQAEERFRMVVESAPNGVVLVNAEGNIVLVNAQCDKLFGYRREELIGQPVELLVPERFRPEHARNRRRFFASPSARPTGAIRDLYGQRKDGDEFPVEIGLAPIQTSEGPLALGVIVDMTERKWAEEARRELAHASRLAMAGELTASVAHEINQPLGAILTNVEAAEMLLESAPESLAEVRQILKDIHRDDLRASEVIQRLRALLRKRETKIEPVDCNELISDVLLLLGAESRCRHVNVETQLAADLPFVLGDKVHLQQVLLNLLLNGMDAMADKPGEKTLTVRTALNQSGYVEIAISDVGTGIRRDRLSHLFEPFFSTKREGMGLGLSLARALVEANGGRIWAENNSGAGATFRFALPVNGEPADRRSMKVEHTAVETSV
jgi:PAS domain S-box-containing protein